jgi:hypothetical protein
MAVSVPMELRDKLGLTAVQGPTIQLRTCGLSLRTTPACQPPIRLSHAHAASMEIMSSWRLQRTKSRLVLTLHGNAICVSSSATPGTISCRIALNRLGNLDLTSTRGRSTGYGSLIINTHSFKDVKFTQKYSGPGEWTGSAATVGAGVQGRELFRQAFAQSPKVVIVGGECPVSILIAIRFVYD